LLSGGSATNRVMARREPPERSATNRNGPAGDEVRGALERYRESLEDAPLALRTRQAYAAHVAAYASWLAGRPKAAAALHLPRARDLAARDFKRMLKLERGWKPSSVNLALSAVDHFKVGSPCRYPWVASRRADGAL